MVKDHESSQYKLYILEYWRKPQNLDRRTIVEPISGIIGEIVAMPHQDSECKYHIIKSIADNIPILIQRLLLLNTKIITVQKFWLRPTLSHY